MEESSTAHSLITRDILQNALKKDLGSQWTLNGFEIIDFTEKGDNFASSVTGIVCTGYYKENQVTKHYVAKLDTLANLGGAVGEMSVEMFQREGLFFTKVMKKLNESLIEFNQLTLNIPKCLYFDEDKPGIIIIEDLRPKGCIMLDRLQGVELQHSKLLVQELARLHASSVIVKNKLHEDVLDFYPFLKDKSLDDNNSGQNPFENFLKNNLTIFMKLISHLEKYEKHKLYFQKLRETVVDIFGKQLNSSKENLKVINHGDCWNNNVMFRNDDFGNPVQVYLIDLQLCRYTSASVDLSYYFYTSLTGKQRKEDGDALLSTYYDEFRHVMSMARAAVPFSEQELREDFHDRSLYGILNGLVTLPLAICRREESINLLDLMKENAEDKIDEFAVSLCENSDLNEIFYERMFSLLDDLVTEGLVI